MAWHLETSILETAHLVGYSRAAVVSMYQKWCTKGQTMNRHPAIVHSDRWATVRQITSSYNSRAMCHSTQFISALCVRACIADHPHANARNHQTHEMGPKIIETGLWMIGRKWPGVTNQDSWGLIYKACVHSDLIVACAYA